jgi:hypothetical protein
MFCIFKKKLQRKHNVIGVYLFILIFLGHYKLTVFDSLACITPFQSFRFFNKSIIKMLLAVFRRLVTGMPVKNCE